MKSIMSTAFVAILLACASEAPAECICRCINGELGAICLGPTDVPPACVPRICPASPQSTPPRIAQKAPPAGTTQCRMAQVLNPQTDQYEWIELCR